MLGAARSSCRNPGEVERVFDVALADLVADGVFHEERWRLSRAAGPGSPDGSFPVWFFEVGRRDGLGGHRPLLMELVDPALGLATADDPTAAMPAPQAGPAPRRATGGRSVPAGTGAVPAR